MADPAVEDHLLLELAQWHGRGGATIVTSGHLDAAAHFGAQLRALRAIGLLTDAEAEDWRERFAGGFPDEPELVVDAELRSRVERYLGTLTGDDLARAMEVLDSLELLSEEEIDHWFERIAPQDDDRDDIRRMIGRELRTVLAGPDEELDGLRVVSVELYDDGVAVRWTAVPGHGLDRWGELSDDVGTGYEPAGGGEGGGGPDMRAWGVSEFVPAVPANASRIALALAGHRFELELPR